MTMVWHWPQIVIAIMLIGHVMAGAALDGKPFEKGSKHSFAVCLCRAALYAFLLFMGGFFTGGQ